MAPWAIFSRRKAHSPPALQLPRELWFHVASYLDDQTLKDLYSVSRVFYALSMSARYRHIDLTVPTGEGRSPCMLKMIRLFKHIKASGIEVGPRVHSISASDTIFHGYMPRTAQYKEGVYIIEAPAKGNILFRLRGIILDIRITPWRSKTKTNLFKSFTNTQKLHLHFNGPFYYETAKNSGLFTYCYLSSTHIDEGLRILSHAFHDNLLELSITIIHAPQLRKALTLPTYMTFSNLQTLVLRPQRHFQGRLGPIAEFSQFLNIFHQTLRVLRLELHNLESEPLKSMFNDLKEFPLLDTLDICDIRKYTAAERRGWAYVSSFIAVCSRKSLKNVSCLSISTDIINDHDREDCLILPNITFNSLAVDSFLSETSGSNIDRHLRSHMPGVLKYNGAATTPQTLSFLLNLSSKYNTVTTLHLTFGNVFLIDLLEVVSNLHILEVLKVETEWVILDNDRFYIPTEEESLSQPSWYQALTRLFDEGVFSQTNLKTIEFLRNPDGTYDRGGVVCKCSTMRLAVIEQIFTSTTKCMRGESASGCPNAQPSIICSACTSKIDEHATL